MYNKRQKLQDFLKTLCDNVYFQPPKDILMEFPAIVYKLSDVDNTTADNAIYVQNLVYEVVVLDGDSESEIVSNLCSMLKFKFVRQYTANDLYHTVFEYYI